MVDQYPSAFQLFRKFPLTEERVASQKTMSSSSRTSDTLCTGTLSSFYKETVYKELR